MAGRQPNVVQGGDWEAIERHLDSARESCSDAPSLRQSVDELANYLRPQEHHLNYAERLNSGQSIGSGLIEGACENLIDAA